MRRIDVLQHGGGWSTNIGNAFIDLGCMECLKEAASKANINVNIHLTSSFGRWVFSLVNRGIKGYLLKQPGEAKNFLNLQNYVEADYVVQWGPFLSRSWIQLHGDFLSKLSKRGIKIVINGGGIGEDAYSEEEIEKTRKFLKRLRPYVFISRSEKAFKSFNDLADHSYNGIDCAFWVSKIFPLKLDIPEYVVLNFDKQPEPEGLMVDNDKFIVRVHHSIWHNFSFNQYFRMKKNYYDLRNSMISELPYDYLTLYANANSTYSDRVHACIATLAYGNSARLFSDTPRANLFEKVGASEISEKLIKANLDKIEAEKSKQTDFLSELL